MYKRLRHEVEKVNGEVIRLTQDLVRIPSPSLHEKEVAAKLDEVMRALRYDHVFTDDVGNIVGVIVGSDPSFTILMSTHMDTVRPDRIEDWRRSPFGGDIVRGRIEGVGSADCKGGLASQIYAGRVLSASRFVPTGSIVVAATVAGQNGVGVGLRHLLKTTLPELGKQPGFVVLGEPTALMVDSGHDGWVEIDIDVISPVVGVARSAAEHVFHLLSAHCHESGLPESRAIMTVTKPRAGRSNHGLLETVQLCRRLSLGESEDDVLGWLDKMVLESTREMHAAFLDARVRQEEQRLYTGHSRRVRMSVPPWSTSLMHPLVDRAREAMLAAGCRWVPESWRMGRLGTGTAGGVASREFGIPVIGYGPGGEEQADTCNESVGLPALIEAVYGTAALMRGLSATPQVEHEQPDVVHVDEERLVASAAEGGSR